MTELGIGIIGAGGMGSEHARNLAAIDGVKIVMVVDALLPAAEDLVMAVGGEPSTDASALITDQRVDALVIASPDETHPELATAAVAAGKLTLCEKPLAATLDDAITVMNDEVATGRRLIQLGLMRVYDPTHVALRADVGANGPVRHIRAVHRNRNDFLRTVDHSISQSMVHDIHTVRWLTASEFTSVHTRVVPRSDSSVRFVVVSARLASGALVSLEFDDYGFGYDVSVEVTGESGLARTPEPSDPSLHNDWFAWFATAYRLEAEAWVASLQAGAATGPSAWDGVASQAVVRAIQESVRTGCEEPVMLPERPDLYR